jgi:heterodisulfide reductase subunit A
MKTTQKKTRPNTVLGLLFVLVTVLMALFNSCDKYDKTYSVNDSSCSLCMSCISVCGQHAISLVTSGSTKYIQIDDSKCIGCGKCYNACPDRAIYSN